MKKHNNGKKENKIANISLISSVNANGKNKKGK